MFKRKNTRVSKPCPQPVSSREKFRHPLLGEITLNRSPRARRLSISVRPDGEVRLTIPCGDNEHTALNFLDQKSAWIEQARARMLARHPQQIIEPPYSTRSHTLRLYPCACRTIRIRVSEGIIEVRYPMEIRYEAAEVQNAIRKGIEQAWRTEAQADLPQRTARLAGQLGFRCGAVTVRNARTRWGSCSARDDISLSIHLMKLPDELIDYVIIHELCHTIHKNHGPKFHQLLNRLTGGHHLELRRRLKTYSTRW